MRASNERREIAHRDRLGNVLSSRTIEIRSLSSQLVGQRHGNLATGGHRQMLRPDLRANHAGLTLDERPHGILELDSNTYQEAISCLASSTIERRIGTSTKSVGLSPSSSSGFGTFALRGATGRAHINFAVIDNFIWGEPQP